MKEITDHFDGAWALRKIVMAIAEANLESPEMSLASRIDNAMRALTGRLVERGRKFVDDDEILDLVAFELSVQETRPIDRRETLSEIIRQLVRFHPSCAHLQADESQQSAELRIRRKFDKDREKLMILNHYETGQHPSEKLAKIETILGLMAELGIRTEASHFSPSRR